MKIAWYFAAIERMGAGGLGRAKTYDTRTKGLRLICAVVIATATALSPSASVLAIPCITSTSDVPPTGTNCTQGYLGPLNIIDGLPSGTTIEIDASFRDFFNLTSAPGGSLGGTQETFDGFIRLELTGTGALAGFMRTMFMQIAAVTDTESRTPSDPVQAFGQDMRQLQGAIFGDPDFDLLQFTAGTDFGLPSPGHTKLDQLPDTTWNVDSFFDIAYEIDFQGAPGSILETLSGSTNDTTRIQAGMAIPEPSAALLLMMVTGVVIFGGPSKRLTTLLWQHCRRCC